MSSEPVDDGTERRTAERTDELLPEERSARSDAPRAQAAAVLADSDERAAARDGDDDDGPLDVEHRTSAETVEP